MARRRQDVQDKTVYLVDLSQSSREADLVFLCNEFIMQFPCRFSPFD